MGIKEKIRTIPDYPKAGILFRDITTLLQDAVGFRRAVDGLVQLHAGVAINKVATVQFAEDGESHFGFEELRVISESR